MTISRVQNWTVANKGDGSGSTVTNTLTSVPTAGNLLVACLSSGDGGGAITISSFDDNIGDSVSWTAHPDNPRGLGTDLSGTKYRMYYKVVGTPSGGGKAVQCTITGTQALQLFVAEYGIASGTPSWAVDGTPISAVGLIGVADAGDITTAGSDDVLVGFSGCGGAPWGAGTNYTRQATSGNWASDAVEDRLVSSPNTYAVDWTSAGGDDVWAAMGIAFRADAGGGSTTHTSTGALTGQGSTVAGTAAHIAKHATTGALAGQGSTIAGTARRFRAHATSGALTGHGSVIAGTATHLRPHATSGVLTGQGSSVSGVASRFRAHATSGVMTGQGSTVAGTAARSSPGVHNATGAMVGQGSSIVGTAAHIAVHASSGALTGPGAVISGAANRTAASVTHDATGGLVGPGAIIVGQAFNGIAAQGATPGYYRQDYERWKAYRQKREREREEYETELKVDRERSDSSALKEKPTRSPQSIDREIIRLQKQTAQIEREIEEIDRQLEEKNSIRLAEQLEHEKLLREQEVAFIQIREAVEREEMEVMDIAFVVMMALDSLSSKEKTLDN